MIAIKRGAEKIQKTNSLKSTLPYLVDIQDEVFSIKAGLPFQISKQKGEKVFKPYEYQI
jgi:hypothetical protein